MKVHETRNECGFGSNKAHSALGLTRFDVGGTPNRVIHTWAPQGEFISPGAPSTVKCLKTVVMAGFGAVFWDFLSVKMVKQ